MTKICPMNNVSKITNSNKGIEHVGILLI